MLARYWPSGHFRQPSAPLRKWPALHISVGRGLGRGVGLWIGDDDGAGMLGAAVGGLPVGAALMLGLTVGVRVGTQLGSAVGSLLGAVVGAGLLGAALMLGAAVGVKQLQPLQSQLYTSDSSSAQNVPIFSQESSSQVTPWQVAVQLGSREYRRRGRGGSKGVQSTGVWEGVREENRR